MPNFKITTHEALLADVASSLARTVEEVRPTYLNVLDLTVDYNIDTSVPSKQAAMDEICIGHEGLIIQIQNPDENIDIILANEYVDALKMIGERCREHNNNLR